MNQSLSTQTLLQDARTAYVFPAAELESLIGGSSVTLPAGTDIAAGTSVSVDGNGNVVQTWGPAIGTTVELISGAENTAMPAEAAVCMLSATDFLAFVTSGSGAGSYFSLVAGSISGATINVGEPVTPPTDIFSLIPLTASTFVGLDNGGNAYFGSIAGGVITLSGAVSTGMASILATGALSSLSFAAIDSNGKAAVGTISGTITVGATVVVGSGNFNNGAVQVEALGSSAFVAVFGDGDNADVLTAVVGSVSGTGVTFGTPATVIGSSVGLMSQPGVLSETSFVVGYSGNTLGDPGFGVVATVSGSTVTFGSPVQIANMSAQSAIDISSSNNIPLAVIDDAHVAFGFSFVLPQVCTVSGTTLTAPAAVPLSRKGVVNAVVPVGSGLMVVDSTPNVYEVDASSNSSPYLAQAGLWNYGLSPIDATRVLAWFLNLNGDLQARVITYQPIAAAGPIAFASEAVSAGQNGNFTLGGVAGGFSGLSPGTRYYVNGDGTLTAANTGHPAGIALPNGQLLAGAP